MISAKPLPFTKLIGNPFGNRPKEQFPARLPKRKDVTIVAGFTSNSGVVLAADSQEVISEYTKASTQKILVFYHAYEWCISIAGAAEDSAYLELFQNELSSKLFADVDQYDYDKILAITKAVLHRFHKQHIWPQRDKKSPFQALIVTQCVAEPTCPEALQPRLLEIKDSAVVEVSGFRSVGVGTHMAKYLERYFLRGNMMFDAPLDHIADVMILMLKEIKKAIVGCDGLTTVSLFYADGRQRFMTTEEVKEVEELAEEMQELSLVPLLALTDPSVSDNGFAGICDSASIAMKQFMAKRSDFVTERQKVIKKLPSYRGKKAQGHFNGSSRG
jgi:20S proteasome alpha/beta subunit